ncbi:HAD family hydrolase [Aureibacillus halotolerans]|uniref:Putative hydrolase of the HAD superfamily n=1 Tax=Aureibacillus halotolerans TaxID=1508390 RepID=A0A4R6UCU8_9BACI|nr:HAD family hydrolase [Aureibacillus halotolerans]TDQ42585.1 putative hydrolase of the HAD superfamily [Aureibacillus halotolerans]
MSYVALFDIDDTLYDQMQPFTRAVNDCAPEILQATEAQHYFKRVRFFSDHLWDSYTSGDMSIETHRDIRLIAPAVELGIDMTIQQARSLQERYAHYQQQLIPFEGLVDLWDSLEADGWTIGILSNGPSEHQRNKLKALGLAERVQPQYVLVSDDIGIAKPDKRLFNHYLQTHDLPPEKTVYVGDHWENDIVGATSASIPVIWFNHRKKAVAGDYPVLAETYNVQEWLPLFQQHMAKHSS